MEVMELRQSQLLLIVAGVALVVAACAPGGGDAASSGLVIDGGLTIPEAIAYQGDQIVAVKGFVFRDDQTDALCELLAESYPPQCGGASLIIENPEATGTMVLQEAGGVQWSDEYVTVFGRISNGRLTIDTTVIG